MIEQPKLLHSTWYAPQNDTKISSHLDSKRTDLKYEKKFRDLIVSNLPNKRTFVDVGANVGIWTKPLAQEFDTIFAYEPSPKNMNCLKLNCQGIKNIEFVQKGLSNFSDNVLFYDAVRNCGNTKMYRTVDKVRDGDFYCDVEPLDDTSITDIDLIKIDTQGYEYEVLTGAKEKINKYKPWISHEVNRDIDRVYDFIESFGFYKMIRIKSKRMFIWAPTEGPNKPKDISIFGSWMGDPPFSRFFNGRTK